MPLPALSEQAANQVARILNELDQAIEAHLLENAPLPDPDSVLGRIEQAVTASVAAGLFEVDPDTTARDIAQASAVLIAPIAQAVFNALGAAQRLKRRLPPDPPSPDPGERFRDFVTRVGPLAALAAAATGVARTTATARRRILARQAGVPLPRKTAAYGRMIVRTETANARNRRTADVVERRNQADGVPLGGARPGEWAVYVEDARLGPTDEPCEDVDGRWATPRWLRNNLTEHPNCTRRGRPRRLPAGAAVTLIE